MENFPIPKEYVTGSWIDGDNLVNIGVNAGDAVLKPENFSIEPDMKIEKVEFSPVNDYKSRGGYKIEGENIVFMFSSDVYNKKIPDNSSIYVCGSFNGWGNAIHSGKWLMKKSPSGSLWTLPVSASEVLKGETPAYKFVMFTPPENTDWLQPPEDAQNIFDDGDGNSNLLVERSPGRTQNIVITTSTPFDLSNSYKIAITGLDDKPVKKLLSPRGIFKTSFISDKKLGVTYIPETDETVFSVFSPRAKTVRVAIFPGAGGAPEKTAELSPSPDGVWEIKLPGKYFGKYYGYYIDGPDGEGEGFRKDKLLSDPYAAANVHRDGRSIIIDPDEGSDIWTDQNFKPPAPRDAVISEVHIRDFTSLISSIPTNIKGKYLAWLETKNTGTGIDHLKNIGVNTVELLPVFEFDEDPPGEYHWGYMTTLYFAPESSFSTDPVRGKQVTEIKKLVNFLHENGIAVILDVVYNHTGWPNWLSYYDRKYYYRLNPDFTDMNFSGCGNDFQTETPMTRKLIIDSLLHWIKYYHVDGFRFDLAELIDIETLLEIEKSTKKLNPGIILIAEPWSFRGNIKGKLKGTAWASWNDDFRNGIKDYACGKENRERAQKVITGSVDIWTDNPMQTINYLESHDDMTLADELTSRSDRDGRFSSEDDIARNKISAVLLFTSLGIPMIACGQEFLRSKHGISNSYNKGDVINGLDWTLVKKNSSLVEYYRGLIRFRLSDKGKALRYTDKPAEGYVRWVLPASKSGIGYIMNADNTRAGVPPVLVLVNSSDIQYINFLVNLPGGKWIQISDGTSVDINGLPGGEINGGKQVFKIPPISSRIYIKK